ncbi:MAG TPA: hypothetical protein VD905_22095 [Flavobacteriales bacterium]|nr:hypothetical protein [Flavobacteriales bacterium]
MTKTKAKPDLNGSLAKARAATTKVISAKKEFDAQKGDYRTIPLTPKYEINSKDIVRSKATGQPVGKKNGTNKFYLLNKSGDRKLYTIEELKASLPPAPPQVKTPAKPTESKKEKKSARILELHDAGQSYAEIVKETGFKYNTVYMTIKVETARRIISGGGNVNDVAQKLDTTPERASAFLERSGIYV